MRKAALAALLALAPAAASAKGGFGASEAGTSGGTFLKLGADARAAGMGGAVRAATDDATAIYWNPAGLAGLRYRHATFTHSAAYQSTFHDFIAYAQPVESPFRGSSGRERDLRPDSLGTLGIAVLYQNAGALSEVDNTGLPTGDKLTPQDMAVLIAWGGTVSRGLDLGVGLKYVTSKIQSTAQTGALDLGARWRTWLPGDFPYALAVTATNLGGQLKFHEVAAPLPMTFAVAQAVRVTKGLTLSLDFVAPRDRALYPCFGMEWRVPMQQGLAAAARAGYDGRLGSGDSDGGVRGVTFGGGLVMQRFGFDYGWSPQGYLGTIHRLSLSYRF